MLSRTSRDQQGSHGDDHHPIDSIPTVHNPLIVGTVSQKGVKVRVDRMGSPLHHPIQNQRDCYW